MHGSRMSRVWKIQAHENTKISFKKSMDHRFLVVAYMAFCYLMTL